jgi:hypothetical protein
MILHNGQTCTSISKQHLANIFSKLIPEDGSWTFPRNVDGRLSGQNTLSQPRRPQMKLKNRHTAMLACDIEIYVLL